MAHLAASGLNRICIAASANKVHGLCRPCYRRRMSATVTVSARGAQRIRAGHPWVFAPDVLRASDGRGALLGTALHAAGARLPLRMLARGEVALDGALLERRIGEALARRRALYPTADAFRVVHGEADLLPGLVVDRYGDVAVIQ